MKKRCIFQCYFYIFCQLDDPTCLRIYCTVLNMIIFFVISSGYWKIENRMVAVFDLILIHPRISMKNVSSQQTTRKCASDRSDLQGSRRIFAASKIFTKVTESPRHLPDRTTRMQWSVTSHLRSEANRPGQLLLRLHAVQIRSSGATTAFKNKPAAVYNYTACVFFLI